MLLQPPFSFLRLLIICSNEFNRMDQFFQDELNLLRRRSHKGGQVRN